MKPATVSEDPLHDGATRRRTQAERRAETERRVLDATTRLVAEGGVRSVTLAAVGEEAGYSRGIVTHHFGGRRGLLDALVARLQDRFVLPSVGGPGLSALLTLVDAYLADLRARSLEARAFLVLWGEAMAAEPALRPVFAERDERFRGAIAAALRRGAEDGSVRGDVDAEGLAVAVVGLLRGTGLQLLIVDQLDLAAVRRQVGDLLRIGLAGSPPVPPGRRKTP